jgi:hypothetical protein
MVASQPRQQVAQFPRAWRQAPAERLVESAVRLRPPLATVSLLAQAAPA